MATVRTMTESAEDKGKGRLKIQEVDGHGLIDWSEHEDLKALAAKMVKIANKGKKPE